MSATRARKLTGSHAGESVTVSSTDAKNRLREVLDLAGGGATVVITTYDRPAAVVISPERYRELTGDQEVDLEALTREFDALVERMQGTPAEAAFDALFEMDSEALGEAASASAAAE